jgi:hypothetical protein
LPWAVSVGTARVWVFQKAVTGSQPKWQFPRCLASSRIEVASPRSAQAGSGAISRSDRQPQPEVGLLSVIPSSFAGFKLARAGLLFADRPALTGKTKRLPAHRALVLVIARRGSGFQGRPNGESATIATAIGNQVRFPLPVRSRAKHEWAYRRASPLSTKTALEAPASSCERGDPSKQQTCPWQGKGPVLTVRPREVGRRQHCPAGVGNAVSMDSDMPYLAQGYP